jgi:succinyl-CoA synthetase beta subunit
LDDVMEAFHLLSQYVDVPPMAVVSSPDGLRWERYPAVAKIASMEHKTDRGGVVLNIQNGEELHSAVERLLKLHPKVIIQPQLSGVEVFLGGKEDPSFGPTVSLGLGGVFVEVYKDISTRLAPLTGADVLDMVEELRGKKLLQGYRGKKVNFNALVKAVISFSRFMERYRPRVAEINPLIVNEQGAFAVDVRLFLD